MHQYGLYVVVNSVPHCYSASPDGFGYLSQE
ncbi:unnamed protein product, partial [marine sediment metagenome]